MFFFFGQRGLGQRGGVSWPEGGGVLARGGSCPVPIQYIEEKQASHRKRQENNEKSKIKQFN